MFASNTIFIRITVTAEIAIAIPTLNKIRAKGDVVNLAFNIKVYLAVKNFQLIIRLIIYLVVEDFQLIIRLALFVRNMVVFRIIVGIINLTFNKTVAILPISIVTLSTQL